MGSTISIIYLCMKKFEIRKLNIWKWKQVDFGSIRILWAQECKVQTQFPWDMRHISKSQYLVPSLISNGVYPKAILSNRDWSIHLEFYFLQSEVYWISVCRYDNNCFALYHSFDAQPALYPYFKQLKNAAYYYHLRSGVYGLEKFLIT